MFAYGDAIETNSLDRIVLIGDEIDRNFIYVTSELYFIRLSQIATCFNAEMFQSIRTRVLRIKWGEIIFHNVKEELVFRQLIQINT